MRVQRLPAAVGRDFVVGDIHGMFHLVRHALECVNFDARVDRLISVGDLVDRGPYSAEVLAFLAEEGVYATMGNHEQMFLSLYAAGTPPEQYLASCAHECGQQWWLEVPAEARQRYLDVFSQLPLAIEIPTSTGRVGILHAEVPVGMDWDHFLALVEAGDRRACMSALWGRSRCEQGHRWGVNGVERVYSGHTVLDRMTHLGNVT